MIEPLRTGSRLTYRLHYRPTSRWHGLFFFVMMQTIGVRQLRKMLRSYEQERGAG